MLWLLEKGIFSTTLAKNLQQVAAILRAQSPGSTCRRAPNVVVESGDEAQEANEVVESDDKSQEANEVVESDDKSQEANEVVESDDKSQEANEVVESDDEDEAVASDLV